MHMRTISSSSFSFPNYRSFIFHTRACAFPASLHRKIYCVWLDLYTYWVLCTIPKTACMASEEKPRRPTRIILVRHGESEGNVDQSKYCSIADSKIRLTNEGMKQAEACGKAIRQMIVKNEKKDWQVYFYVSPYRRTLCTLKGIGRAFERERILGVREEPRLREQDFGNFQEQKRMTVIKEVREQFGRFFYRFPEGESGADVFDRVTSFLESLWRDIDTNRLNRYQSTDLNLVIVSHGVTMRIFLMRWFKWTTQQFEMLNNPENCEVRVMQLGSGGEYSLAVHHSREELEQWGLSPEMIADQEWRAKAQRGRWYDEWPWCGAAFFDHFGAQSPTKDPQQQQHTSKFIPLDEEQSSHISHHTSNISHDEEHSSHNGDLATISSSCL